MLVGALMMQGLARVGLTDLANAVPIILTLLATVLTNNLVNGMAPGTLSFILIALASGRARDMSGVVWGLGVVFLASGYVTTALV